MRAEAAMAAISSKTASAAESVQVLPPAERRILEDLAVLDDRQLLGIVRALPRFSERRAAACDLLVSRHRNVVWSWCSGSGAALSRPRT
jgi:hypothetical protein